MTIELPVRRSERPALIDDDLTQLLRFTWKLDHEGYVRRRTHGRDIYLHKVVLGPLPTPAHVRDHINRDKLDNRRENLRFLTRSEHVQNTSAQRRNSTGVRGVTFIPSAGRYRATVGAPGPERIQKWFGDLEGAAAFVSEARRRLYPFSHEADS